MSVMLPLMMMVEDHIYSVAAITKGGIIVKNRNIRCSRWDHEECAAGAWFVVQPVRNKENECSTI